MASRSTTLPTVPTTGLAASFLSLFSVGVCPRGMEGIGHLVNSTSSRDPTHGKGGPGLPRQPFLEEEEDFLRGSLSRFPSSALPSHRCRMLILSSLILEEPQCSGPLVQSFIGTSKPQIYWFSCEFYILLTNPQSRCGMNSTIFVLTALVTDILSVGHLPQHCCRRLWGLCRLWEIRLSSQQTANVYSDRYTFLSQTASYFRHSRHPCPSVFSSWHRSTQTLVQTVP